MSPEPASSSARAARVAVAARLRELRQEAGITGQKLAARCGWSKSKSSRIENAVTPPSDADIRVWCAVCGAVDQAPDIMAASRTADSMYVQWRRLQRTGLRRLQESVSQLYQETRLLRVYCSDVVPGVLQTPGYASALLSAIARFRGTPDDVAEAVAARTRRSAVLRQRGHRFALLIEEAVLYHRIGDASVMAEQLAQLMTGMSLPSVWLGIIPPVTQRSMWPLESFTVFDDQRVHVDSLTAAVTITQPSEVMTYVQAFGELQRLAVHGDAARVLVERAAGGGRCGYEHERTGRSNPPR